LSGSTLGLPGASLSKRIGKFYRLGAACRGGPNETSTARATRAVRHQTAHTKLSFHTSLFLTPTVSQVAGIVAHFFLKFQKKIGAAPPHHDGRKQSVPDCGVRGGCIALSSARALCRPLALSVPASLAARIPRALRASHCVHQHHCLWHDTSPLPPFTLSVPSQVALCAREVVCGGFDQVHERVCPLFRMRAIIS